MAWTGLNKREFPRVNAALNINIDDRSGTAIAAQTENVGAGGVCVILDREIEKFSTVHLKLQLAQGNEPFVCDGRIVWIVKSRRIGSPSVLYDTGIEFINLKDEDRVEIIKHISQLAAQEQD